MTVRLNFRTRVATLVASDDQPEGLSAQAGVNTYRAYQFRWPARTQRHRQ